MNSVLVKSNVNMNLPLDTPVHGFHTMWLSLSSTETVHWFFWLLSSPCAELTLFIVVRCRNKSFFLESCTESLFFLINSFDSSACSSRSGLLHFLCQKYFFLSSTLYFNILSYYFLLSLFTFLLNCFSPPLSFGFFTVPTQISFLHFGFF